MNLRKLFTIILCLTCLELALWAEDSFEKKITWKPVEGAFSYLVEVRKVNGAIVQSETSALAEVQVTLPPGEYELRVTVLNKFMKSAAETPWKKITIKRTVKPVISQLTPSLVYSGDSEVKIAVFGSGFLSDSIVTLEKENTKIKASVFLANEQGFIATFNLSDAELGSYSLVVSNPQNLNVVADTQIQIKLKSVSLSTEGEKVTAGNLEEQKRLQAELEAERIAREKLEAEKLAREKLEEEKRLQAKLLEEKTSQEKSAKEKLEEEKRLKAKLALEAKVEAISKLPYKAKQSKRPATPEVVLVLDEALVYKNIPKLEAKHNGSGVFLGSSITLMQDTANKLCKPSYLSLEFQAQIPLAQGALDTVPFINLLGISFDSLAYALENQDGILKEEFIQFSLGTSAYLKTKFPIPIQFRIGSGFGATWNFLKQTSALNKDEPVNKNSQDFYFNIFGAIRYEFKNNIILELGPSYRINFFGTEQKPALHLFLRTGIES